MSASPVLHTLHAFAVAKAAFLGKEIGDLLLAPGSTFSLISLASALVIAVGFILARRATRGRRLSLKLVARALFPRWLTRSDSTRADFGFMLLNVFALGGLIGWALLSGQAVSHWTDAVLTRRLGAGGWLRVNPVAAEIGFTLVSFLVYELAYWLNHYVSHEVPVLWAFHRVHHTAETLTPVTVFRVHPVDTLVFYNMIAVLGGVAEGAMIYALGWKASSINVGGANIILLTFVFLTVHLQHSHMWIAFTGVWGRVFASPAHHQLHHSTDPAHFGKNLGSCLALWDWVFGTLRLPSWEREHLTYGVEPEGERPHGLTDGLLTPFKRAVVGQAIATASWIGRRWSRAGAQRPLLRP